MPPETKAPSLRNAWNVAQFGAKALRSSSAASSAMKLSISKSSGKQNFIAGDSARPVNVAVLGARCSGKSAFISRICGQKSNEDVAGQTPNARRASVVAMADSERGRISQTVWGGEKTNEFRYVVTAVELPAHADLLSDVLSSLQLVDCAVLVVSAMDGIVCAALREVVREGIPCTFFINKLDLCAADQDEEALYVNLKRILDKVEEIIEDSMDEVLRGSGLCSANPRELKVYFGSAKGNWCFHLNHAVELLEETLDTEDLLQYLWGDWFFDSDENAWTTEEDTPTARRGFSWVAKIIKDSGASLKLVNAQQATSAPLLDVSQAKDVRHSKDISFWQSKITSLTMKFRINAARGTPQADIAAFRLPGGCWGVLLESLPTPAETQCNWLDSCYQGRWDDAVANAIRTCDTQGPLVGVAVRRIDGVYLRLVSGTLSTKDTVFVQPNMGAPQLDSGRRIAKVSRGLADVDCGAALVGVKCSIQKLSVGSLRVTGLYAGHVAKVVGLPNSTTSYGATLSSANTMWPFKGPVLQVPRILRVLVHSSSATHRNNTHKTTHGKEAPASDTLQKNADETMLPQMADSYNIGATYRADELTKLIADLEDADIGIHVSREYEGHYLLSALGPAHMTLVLTELGCAVEECPVYMAYREMVATSGPWVAGSSGLEFRCKPLGEDLTPLIALSLHRRMDMLRNEASKSQFATKDIVAISTSATCQVVLTTWASSTDSSRALDPADIQLSAAKMAFGWVSTVGCLCSEPLHNVHIEVRGQPRTERMPPTFIEVTKCANAIRRSFRAASPQLAEAMVHCELHRSVDSDEAAKMLMESAGLTLCEGELRATGRKCITAANAWAIRSLLLDCEFARWRVIDGDPTDCTSPAGQTCVGVMASRGLPDPTKPNDEFTDFAQCFEEELQALRDHAATVRRDQAAATRQKEEDAQAAAARQKEEEVAQAAALFCDCESSAARSERAQSESSTPFGDMESSELPPAVSHSGRSSERRSN